MLTILLSIFILVLSIEGKICNKHIEYRIFGQVIENVKEQKVNCTEDYCTHVTINIHDIFQGFEWGCSSDMNDILSNLLHTLPSLKQEVDIAKGACNNLTTYTGTGDIQNTNYTIYVACNKNNSIRKSTINIISLIFYLISFLFLKYFYICS